MGKCWGHARTFLINRMVSSAEFLEYMMFDVTYHVPKEMQFVAAGKKLTDNIDSKQRVVRYITTEPDIICSFSLGQYKPLSFRLTETDVPVTLYDIGTWRTGKDSQKSRPEFQAVLHTFRKYKLLGTQHG